MKRVLLLLALAAAVPGSTVHAAPADRFTVRGTVTHVFDGDTLEVLLDPGVTERVRLIGINTPERGACYAERARTAARSLADDRRAVLRGDATQERRDRHGRLLAYVWLPDGRDLGYSLIAAGLGKVFVHRVPFQRLSAYREAERRGQRLRDSLWNRCRG